MDKTFNEVLLELEKGNLRSALKIDGVWVTQTKVKEKILEAFKNGQLAEFKMGEQTFIDKHTLLPQEFNLDRGIRLVPGGSSVRRGAYLGKGVIVMPPSYINVGAFVDESTMVDSHVLVGSCAQIGKRVHLSAGVQIGGVLEPIGANPVIIEDDAFIGAGCIVVEGIIVEEKAVLAPSVTLSKSIPIYDLVNECEIKNGIIPKNAIVVPGNRPISTKHTWGTQLGLGLKCAVIVKYRDEKSQESLNLESLLRD